MARDTGKVAVLLFGSGLCALIYQTAWLRELRLIFGASTFATAAVLAIFMGGLGAGSAVLGKRADRQARPLAFYAKLELLIALSAGLSPILIWLIGRIYIALGGSVALGLVLATIVRLLLSAIVLGVPTMLMGGTLPAAARAIETSDDRGRRKVAFLYGANTIGAVTGALLSTFFLLEHFGNRRTLIIAVLLNLLVGVIALSLSRVMPERIEDASDAEGEQEHRASALPPRITLGAAAVVGFAFLLMEMVWYRMLGPLLGGSTFTFGLILAMALLGIGLGGVVYALRGATRPATVGGFAITCTLEALAIVIPFALGDRIAIVANLLRPLGTLGFIGDVLGWTLITLVTVFPAALISGIQFPLLIGLLGRGSDSVGRQVGLAYAWNTAGAIAGSLAGGFGLLPLLSAPGCWRLVAILLAALGLVATLAAVRERQLGMSVISILAAAGAIGGSFALGPTAVWRHAGIGAGRAARPDTGNAMREWINSIRRTLVWDADGLESSVALVDFDDFAFMVNGKADGSARADSGTQVMGGLIGGLLHPAPRTALVIGLGTGSTAGWLGAIPTMQRVDAVELEPAVLRVAAACTPVNRDVLKNPRVHIAIGDAREVLLTSQRRYDIVFSEPSNPYRAGIASLFTQEFYAAAAARMSDGAIFLQWVQTYDVDAETIRTIYATIGSVFPNVETWETETGDVVLAATRKPIDWDADSLRRRITEEPFRSAIEHTWSVTTLEGVLSHYFAGASFAKYISSTDETLNTDDITPAEFGFARGLGNRRRFSMTSILQLSQRRVEDRPAIRGNVDWPTVNRNRATLLTGIDMLGVTAEIAARRRAAIRYGNADLGGVLGIWREHSWTPVNTLDLIIIAEALADSGSEEALPYLDALRPMRPTEAIATYARLRFKQGNIAQATAAFVAAFNRYRDDPWPSGLAMGRAIEASAKLAEEDTTKRYAHQILLALSKPFSAGQWEDARKVHFLTLSFKIDGCNATTLTALHGIEPNPYWREDILSLRTRCYTQARDPLAATAQEELAEFRNREPAGLEPR